jgi:7-cyano-7-deazaguanine synthase
MNKKAVVLLSGGLDSTTVLYYAVKQGYKCACLLFDYGQRHRKELKSAIRIAGKNRCEYRVVKISLPWSSSSLTDKARKIPNNKKISIVNYQTPKNEALPTTYVPGRNTIFLSFALSYAETLGAETIFIGANAVDYSGYPDCRPDYYIEWNRLLKSLGTKITIKAPLIRLDKAAIVRFGYKLGVPFGLTWSCYKGGRKPCGVCDSCRFREKGFEESGVN